MRAPAGLDKQKEASGAQALAFYEGAPGQATLRRLSHA
jgi:hypothetical protein